MILDINNTLGYSVINGRLKLFVKKGIVSESQNTNQSQESSNQEGNTPDISKAEGEVTYYTAIDDNFNKYKSYVIESTDRRSFFQMWKQGNNYYVRVNPNNNHHKSLIQSADSFLEPFFEYTRNPSATKIRNIKPVVYDVTSGSLRQKGKIELS